jgi:aryl-alcohol dehydrogenase-like predicted oxidoreductase
MEANQVLVEYIQTLAEAKNATPPQIALAWAMASKPWIVPIPGTRQAKRIDENIGSLDIAFSDWEIISINQSLSRITISGDRYPEELAKRIGK